MPLDVESCQWDQMQYARHYKLISCWLSEETNRWSQCFCDNPLKSAYVSESEELFTKCCIIFLTVCIQLLLQVVSVVLCVCVCVCVCMCVCVRVDLIICYIIIINTQCTFLMHWIPLWYAYMYEAQSSEHVKQKQQQYKQVDWGVGWGVKSPYWSNITKIHKLHYMTESLSLSLSLSLSDISVFPFFFGKVQQVQSLHDFNDCERPRKVNSTIEWKLVYAKSIWMTKRKKKFKKVFVMVLSFQPVCDVNERFLFCMCMLYYRLECILNFNASNCSHLYTKPHVQ